MRDALLLICVLSCLSGCTFSTVSWPKDVPRPEQLVSYDRDTFSRAIKTDVWDSKVAQTIRRNEAGTMVICHSNWDSPVYLFDASTGWSPREVESKAGSSTWSLWWLDERGEPVAWLEADRSLILANGKQLPEAFRKADYATLVDRSGQYLITARNDGRHGIGLFRIASPEEPLYVFESWGDRFQRLFARPDGRVMLCAGYTASRENDDGAVEHGYSEKLRIFEGHDDVWLETESIEFPFGTSLVDLDSWSEYAVVRDTPKEFRRANTYLLNTETRAIHDLGRKNYGALLFLKEDFLLADRLR